MLNISTNWARQIFVLIAGFAIGVHLVFIFFFPSLSIHFYKLFAFVNGLVINTLFCLVLAGILALVKKSNRLYMQIFLLLIFADAIYVYKHNINFLIHVLLIVILSRLYLLAIKQNPTKTSIKEHLVSDE